MTHRDPAPPSRAGKIVELESIRGVAALLIVFFHMPMWNAGLAQIGLFRNAYLMVDLFFVLSGFVIYKAYAGQLSSAAQLWRFQFLRFGRLYPVHLLFLLVFVLIELAKLLAEQRYGVVSPNSRPFSGASSVTALEAQVLLAQALWTSGYETGFNSPAWSISVEFYTYLVFGLVMLVCRRRKALACAAMSLTALALSQTEVDAYITHLLRGCYGFFMGCCVAALVEHRSRHPALGRGYAIALVLAFGVFLEFKPRLPAYDSLVAPMTALLIYAVVRSEDGWLTRLLRRPALARLGELSYSVYMSHLAVIWVASQVFRVLLQRPVALVNGTIIPQLGTGETLLAWFGILATVLLLSSLTFRFVEQPARRLSRRIAGVPAL